ncbi:Not1-domain-containing protein [Auricularia subglabra TFB-10046 SS5]|nr:Not1-domain-containing protein [Auricularia subglabra TFB-10046 SS5]
MAFLVVNELSKHLWPREHRRFADDPPDIDNCYYWQAVPTNDADLTKWLQVVPNPITHDRSRSYGGTHAPDPDEGTEHGSELYEVGIRIQGYMEGFNISSVGNIWDGIFVEVTVYAEVVVSKNGRIRIQFRPKRVVLLGKDVSPQGHRLTHALHGGADENVPVQHGRTLVSTLSTWNASRVSFVEMPGKPHWFPGYFASMPEVQPFLDAAVRLPAAVDFAAPRKWTLTVAWPHESGSMFGFRILDIQTPGSFDEGFREIMARALLERFIVHRPHPWGAMVTFIELLRNPRYEFWTHDFTRVAPEIQLLLDGVKREVAQM